MTDDKSYIATATTRGRIVIPVALRHKYGIAEGTKVRFTDTGDSIVLVPLTPERVRALRGSLRGRGALNALERDRAAQRER